MNGFTVFKCLSIWCVSMWGWADVMVWHWCPRVPHNFFLCARVKYNNKRTFLLSEMKAQIMQFKFMLLLHFLWNLMELLFKELMQKKKKKILKRAAIKSLTHWLLQRNILSTCNYLVESQLNSKGPISQKHSKVKIIFTGKGSVQFDAHSTI